MNETAQQAADVLAGAPQAVDRVVNTLVYFLVMALVFISMLSSFGVQTASLVAVLGAASFAVGLALQGSLSNFASGVMLLLFRPFKVGDYVDVAGEAGTVKNIAIFTTTLATPDTVRIEVLRVVVKAEPRVLPEPEATIAVAELGDSSVNLVVRPWVNRNDYWAVRFDLIQGIKDALDTAGIEIPFPQRTVTMIGAK